ncbi:MAG: hypothetical protein ACI9SD_001663 [Pseudohongiellaceae bacterium]
MRQVKYLSRYYHLISRCVRRAYLCGEDAYTKQSYEHRSQWMVDCIRFLTSVFAIDVAAYAVMSNHYHLVVDEDEEKIWSDEEVCQRWQQLYHSHPLVERLQKRQCSCSEVYSEKAFDNTGFRPEKRLLNAVELGETSLMFLVHQHLPKLK